MRNNTQNRLVLLIKPKTSLVSRIVASSSSSFKASSASVLLDTGHTVCSIEAIHLSVLRNSANFLVMAVWLLLLLLLLFLQTKQNKMQRKQFNLGDTTATTITNNYWTNISMLCSALASRSLCNRQSRPRSRRDTIRTMFCI